MKTILQHLQSLPEPYRSQAIENYKKEWQEITQTEKCESIHEALSSAFIWSNHEQTFHYWKDFYDSL